MKKIIGSVVFAVFVSACGVISPSSETYCLEEQELNGYDYMVVTELSICDTRTDDVEIYEGEPGLSIGDIAYVESDGNHSKSQPKNKTEVKVVPSPPAYTPKPAAPTKAPVGCVKGIVKPAPAPNPPAPAPVPKPVQPAPKPVPVPTVKAGC